MNVRTGARSDVPGRTGVGETGAADQTGPVHVPGDDLAAAVLPQNIGSSVVIVIAGAHDVPVRPGITETGRADHGCPVHFPDRRLSAAVLPQNVAHGRRRRNRQCPARASLAPGCRRLRCR